jgi:hypothetical protein
MSKSPSQKTWGYVFVVRSFARFKIGWTGDLKTLQARLRRLHNLNAYGIEVMFVIRSRRSFQIERLLQQQFDEQRTHGEWFELTDEQVANLEADYRRDIFYPDELSIEL